MDATTFAAVADTFAHFHARFAPLFGRREVQTHSEQYVRGLLVQQTDRRNAENVAEMTPGAKARNLQHVLSEAPWATAGVRAEVHRLLGERLSHPAGVLLLDETGFPKQGRHSVGVARQYCGRLGKIANCQMGVFVAYRSPRGQALLDGALYLPQAWCDDPARRMAAGVPETVTCASKAELGRRLLHQIREEGHFAGEWVTADEGYGKDPGFREALSAEGWQYVLEVPASTQVVPVAALPPEAPLPRRPHRKQAHDAQGVARPVPPYLRVDGFQPPEGTWQALTVGQGVQGPLRSRLAATRVRVGAEGMPGETVWLIWRTRLDGTDPKWYLSNAPADVPLQQVAEVAGCRWGVETAFETAKGECGLDEYEVRSWRGWHHPILLARLAGAFLVQLRQDWGKNLPRVDPSATDAAAARALTASSLDRDRAAGLA